MIKRFFDLIFSSISLAILSPLLLIIGVLIKLDSHGPIFFVQNRIGLHGVKFSVYKFRTMLVGAEKESDLTIGNDRRVTSFGFFLRKWKIDELPQLLNIIRGDMSFVGPRPEIEKYINFYPKESQAMILSVRPGITDLASVELIHENRILAQYSDPESAYIEKIMPRKQKIYEDYVRNRSFFGDLYIIFLTIKRVIQN